MARFFGLYRKGLRRSPIRGAIGLSFALYAAILPRPALAQPIQYDWGSVIAGCEACHGAGGDSRSANIPRLNGQRIDYMLGRLDILGDPLQSESEHSNDPMWHTVSGMNTNIREDIIKYFAAQTPMAARPGALAAKGQEIYERGGESVLACSLCHGAAGEGRDLAPRIAGQHSNYLKAQILEFNSAARPHGTMNSDAHKLTGDQVEAVIAYLGND